MSRKKRIEKNSPDAEKNVSTFRPPGLGKRVPFQAAALFQRGSSLIIDPKGQLFR